MAQVGFSDFMEQAGQRLDVSQARRTSWQRDRLFRDLAWGLGNEAKRNRLAQ